MTTLSPPPSPSAEDQESFVDRLVWWLKGFVWPCFSRPYYAQATGKRLIAGILFLALFAVPQTLATDVVEGTGLHPLRQATRKVYTEYDLPEVTIDNGIAQATPREPFTSVEEGALIAIDTTGQLTRIDRDQFEQGFMLTQTELHILVKKGEYYVTSLEHLHQTFGSPILLTQETAIDILHKQAMLMTPMGRVGIYLYNFLWRLVLLLILGLVIRGILSIKNKGFAYRKVLVVGILANVPTWYVTFLLQKAGVRFFGFYEIVWVLIWGVALWTVPKAADQIQDDGGTTLEA